MTSQINPNNIDGNYPVAGVPNNTQGMRDNFTAIKTNFQYAENEIDDLQSKALLKAALTGTTLDNNMADNLIYAAKIQDFSATLVEITTTSGSIAVDYSAGHFQTIAMAGNISLSFTNFPAAGSVGMMRLQITVDAASRTLTLPAAVSVGTTGVQGYSANVITFATAGVFEFGFVTYDGGTTITLFDLTRPLSYYTNTVTIANTAVSTNAGSGALIVAGGVGVGGNLYVTGDIVGNFVVTGQTFSGNVSAGNFLSSGLVSATSNVIGGNISTAGLVTATGNITGGNLNAAGLSLSGNVLSAINMTANITTSSGNLQAGNLLTGGIASATGNITGGNLRTTGQVSATGNITGGNILGGANVNATTHTGATVSVTGNITGGNILGGANVNATTHTGTTVSVSANITGGNILFGSGVVSGTGNVTGGNVLSSAVVSAVGSATILSGTAVPAGGTTGSGYKFSSTANLGVFFGSGAPTLTAAQGSLYLNTTGSGTANRMYVNTNGTTGWTAVTTAT